MSKNLSILYSLILIFYMIISPCLNLDCNNKKENLQYVEKSNVKTDNKCGTGSTYSRTISRCCLFCNMFFETFVERKPILNEEFESVIIEEKFRPQEARKMTDGNTNKRLLFADGSVIITKGDFVTM